MNEYRQQILSWLDREEWSDWYAVTLTHRCYYTDNPRTKVRPSVFECQRNLRHFLNVTDKRWYGNAARRGFKRCEVIPAFECGLDKTYSHYHLAIKKPIHVPRWKFVTRLHSDWFRTFWGNWEVCISSDIDSGWLRYITKDTRKGHGNTLVDNENIDFTNIWFAG